eukprot:12176898-Alexandrium_andersonii.AAC.1
MDLPDGTQAETSGAEPGSRGRTDQGAGTGTTRDRAGRGLSPVALMGLVAWAVGVWQGGWSACALAILGTAIPA